MELLKSLFSMILSFFNPISLIPIVIIVIILVKKNKEYKEGAYYQVTKHPYLSVRRNTGRYGEYLTYKYLKHMETNGAKFLFNVYVPKDNGETTEIDILMIGSNLILRTATRGTNAGNQFFGCSNYPKCRYIQNITSAKKTVTQ